MQDEIRNEGLLIFSLNQKLVEPNGDFICHESDEIEKDYPQFFTKGFRQIFWKVFDKAWHLETKVNLELGGITCQLKHLVILESEITEDLVSVEGKNYFLVAHVHLISTEKEEKKSISELLRKKMDEENITEEMVFDELSKQVANFYDNNFTSWFSHLDRKTNSNKTGLNIYNLELYKQEMLYSICYLTSLYHFGKLIYWRITRQHVDIKIHELKNDRDTFRLLGDIKLRALNIKRFFTVRNVSNNPDLKRYNRKISEKFKLFQNSQHVDDIQKSILESLNHYDQLNSYQTNKNIQRLLSITAFLALPFTIISALMAISLHSLAIQNTEVLFTNRSLLFVYFLSLLPIVLFYVLSHLIQKVRSIKKAEINRIREYEIF